MAETILPHALASALDGRDRVKLLSLDCFDTLLWRDTHAPRDIFTWLPGATPQQRIWAEARARKAAMVRHRRNETGIAEIHAEMRPDATASDLERSIEAELDAEARHCFAFAPTVELMRTAKRRGIRVVIVSDTYLDARQLRALIARAAGDDVAALVDRFFCSSEHGLSKDEGLLGTMLHAMRIKPERVLHIGDNPKADGAAADAAGIPSLHLVQFSRETEQRLRLEAAAGALVHAGGAAFQPHRATIAAAGPRIEDPAEALGHGVLGPVLLPFAQWIADEARALQASGSRVHMLFLMRDGHLPRRVFEAAFPDWPSHAIELSRFTAIAASLSDEAAVARFIDAELGNGAPAELLRQLLFTPTEIAAMLAVLPRANPLPALLRQLGERDRRTQVVARSRAFADRLTAYIRRAVNPAAGDTLMLVDLGYNGTVQNHAEPVLREKLGVAVAGRYLLLREQHVSGLDKAGFIGGDAHDADTLEAFAANVAVIEQLCTAAQGSVIDYGEGEALRAAPSIKGRQSETREAVQCGAIAYAREHGSFAIRAGDEARDACARRGAVAALARLMFLPQPEELAVLARFEHDVNLGTDGTVTLFDPAVAAQGLKERGLFYLKAAQRMYLPAELRGHGLPLNLTLMAQRRFGLDLRYADFCDHGLDLPILLADGRDVVEASVRAWPTHDGHYLAAVPVGNSQYSVGLQFGRNHEWLQIQSARFVPIEDFLSEKPESPGREIEARPSLEGMDQVAPHLFRCNDANAFLMVPPATDASAGAMMLAICFRPLAPRATQSQPAPPILAGGARP